MLVALLLAITPQAVGPMLPAGSNPDLHRAFNLVAEQMEKGNFDAARANFALVPKFTVTYQWDDSKVPASQKSELLGVRNQAFKTLSGSISGLTFKPSAKPDIKFSFEKSLALDTESGLPRGVALFFSEALNEPRMEAVIGLSRGNPTERTSNVSIHNEIMFSVGSYLGMAPTPFLGSTMGRTDLQMQQHSIVDISEVGTFEYIKSAVRKLEADLKAKRPIKPANPKAVFEPVEVVKGPVIQGTHIEFTVQVANMGDAPLSFKVIPDCGCVTAAIPPIVQPGSAVAVPIKVDTKDITVELNRHLILISNDSSEPIRKYPIRVKTTPRYEIVTKESNILVADENGVDASYYFVSPTEKPLEIIGVELAGNPGRVSFEPWEGAIPVNGQSAEAKRGYLIKLHLDEPQVSGRSAATVMIKTNDPDFGTIRHIVFAQKGIIVMPASIYLGEIGKAEQEASVILSRPNKAFQITKIETDSSFVSAAKLTDKDGMEYKIVCRYNGKAPGGDFRAIVTVHTDDPKQPRIRIPVMGNVR